MRRRDFIATVGGTAAAWPLTAQAQQGRTKVLRVGIVKAHGIHNYYWVDPFRKRLSELGYVEGRTVVYEFAWVEARPWTREAAERALRDLVRRNVDVIYTPASERSFRVVAATVRRTPLVLAAPDFDPVKGGLAPSYSGSGKNWTAIYSLQSELNAKRLQLLKETFPGLKALTVFWDSYSAKNWPYVQATAAKLKLDVFGVEFKKIPYDFERGFATVPEKYRGALFLMNSPSFNQPRISNVPDFALRHGLPAMFFIRKHVLMGGLMSYGANLLAMGVRAAEYVDLIAKGRDPGTLPIGKLEKYDFPINLKTAKALGIKLPRSILLRATEVIE